MSAASAEHVKVAAAVAESKGLEIADIKEDSTFQDLGIDSLDSVELVMSLEDELDMEIELEEKMETVGDLVRYIEGLQQ